MNLSEFIKRLQELESAGHGNLPVAISDWGEDCQWGSMEAACYIKVWENHLKESPSNVKTKHVIIGESYS